MDPVQAVIFDFDGALVDYIRADIEALARLLARLSLSMELDAFVDVSVQKDMEFDQRFKLGTVRPEDNHRYRLFETLNHLGLAWQDEYETIYLQAYLSAMYVFPGAAELVGSLHGRVKLGLLTNCYRHADQKLRIENSGLAGFFDEIAISAEIGHYKPNREAFMFLADRFHLDPSSCLFIGDSEEYDIEGARNAGMHTIRINHGASRPEKTRADAWCSGFAELGALLTTRYGL